MRNVSLKELIKHMQGVFCAREVLYSSFNIAPPLNTEIIFKL
jgi:hypothetical protein